MDLRITRCDMFASRLDMGVMTTTKNYIHPAITDSQGQIDQLEDRDIRNVEAAGSNPALSTQTLA